MKPISTPPLLSCNLSRHKTIVFGFVLNFLPFRIKTNRKKLKWNYKHHKYHRHVLREPETHSEKIVPHNFCFISAACVRLQCLCYRTIQWIQLEFKFYLLVIDLCVLILLHLSSGYNGLSIVEVWSMLSSSWSYSVFLLRSRICRSLMKFDCECEWSLPSNLMQFLLR